MVQICKRADISRTTFHRWKAQDSSPTLRNLESIYDALNWYARRNARRVTRANGKSAGR